MARLAAECMAGQEPYNESGERGTSTHQSLSVDLHIKVDYYM